MKLVIVSPVGLGTEFEIHEGNNLVGRWDPDEKSYPEVDLEQFDSDSKVSRKHCVIEKKGSFLELVDIGSLNGTFLDQGRRKIEPNEKIPLKNGDEFSIGKIVLRIVG
jgi:pSer/pThr/pTyr-binding forkhead associated (FHA) protein